MRAFYDWITDNGWVPVLMANGEHPQCQVPPECIEQGEIILNISATAIRDLKITQDFLHFKASFSGVIYFISIPLQAIMAIYADEDSSQGIFFDPEEEGINFVVTAQSGLAEEGSLSSRASEEVTPQRTLKQKPTLRLVE